MTYNPDTGIAYWKKKEKITKKEDLIFNARFAGKPVGSIDKEGYIVTKINSLSYRVHKLVFFLYYGTDPDCIDHINGITSDNRIINLRSVTNSENQRNRNITRVSKSGIIGVVYSDRYNKWTSSITINRKRLHLGTFNNVTDAKEARVLAEKKYGFTLRQTNNG